MIGGETAKYINFQHTASDAVVVRVMSGGGTSNGGFVGDVFEIGGRGMLIFLIGMTGTDNVECVDITVFVWL